MFNKQARLYIYMSDEIKISRFSLKPNPEGHIFVTEAPTLKKNDEKNQKEINSLESVLSYF